jgi:ATP-binding cassette subfamily B protein
MAKRESSRLSSDAPALPGTPLRFIWYFVAGNIWWYCGMLLLEFIHASCAIFIPYSLGQIIRTVTAHPGSNFRMDMVAAPLCLFFLLSIGEVLFGRLGSFVQVWLGPRERQNVTRALYAYLQHHSHRYFSSHFSGALAHRISETALSVNQILWAIIFDFWPIVITLSVSIALLAHTHSTLAIFVSLWAVAFSVFSYVLARHSQPYSVRSAAVRSESSGKLVDSVNNLNTVRLFARLGFERDFLDKYFGQELKTIRSSNWYNERVRWFQVVSTAILKIGTLYYALRLWATGQIGVGEFVMATTLALLIITEARNLSKRLLDFFDYLGSIANGVRTIVQPHEITDAVNPRSADITHGAIEFRDLSFGYDARKSVFESLNVSIPAGQKVGLVGLSGSGKSTFVSLILRMYDPQKGGIFIDGIDVREMTQESLHTRIAYIPQDPSLFHRSLMENIRYGRLDADDETVIEAARRAHAHEFIIETPHQYESLVGERGVKLSGGQRQRIAIARALLKDAPLLILDEATSALDSVTEGVVQQTLSEIRGKTVIVVAHRLSTIAHLERVLVFRNGRIVEDGTHDALLAQQGEYHRLWTKQVDGFLPNTIDVPQSKTPSAATSSSPDPFFAS